VENIGFPDCSLSAFLESWFAEYCKVTAGTLCNVAFLGGQYLLSLECHAILLPQSCLLLHCVVRYWIRLNPDARKIMGLLKFQYCRSGFFLVKENVAHIYGRYV